jgi:hypothetical protein
MTWDIPAVLRAGLEILDKVIPDADAKNRAKEAFQSEILKIAAAEAQAQGDVNRIEAAHPNLFVSGWRPFCGWVAGCGFAWATLGQPVFSWLYSIITHEPPPVIALPLDILMTTMLGLLGLGSLRTLEHIKGVSSR